MPIHRVPTALVFALDGDLQTAAVLPQIDPFAEAVQRVGEQQLLAVLQRFDIGLKGLDLVFERLPAIDIRVLVLQPFASGAEERRELIHKLGRAPLQGVKRIVEGID